jgi:hypothetical protein
MKGTALNVSGRMLSRRRPCFLLFFVSLSLSLFKKIIIENATETF